MEENEVTGPVENLSAPADESLPTQAPDPAAAAAEPAKPAEPVKELSLKEKFAKKAEEVAARDAAAGTKDPKTGRFLGKNAEKPAENVDPATPADPAAVAPKEGETPAFTPNFKVKVMDKEHEIPKFLHDAVKTPEDERALKEIMEKAIGLDFVKPKYLEAREQAKRIAGDFQNLSSQVETARAHYQRGDLDGFFKQLQIPEEKILQWIGDKLNYNQLPPDQKQVIDARKQAEDRAFQAESQAATYQQQHEQALSQQVQMALESELAKPDVQQVHTAFDSRMGQGAFEAELRRRGDYYWKTEGRVVHPARIVSELMTFLGTPAPATPAAAATPTATPAATPVQAATPAASAPKTPVVPNISGRSASVVKTQIRSIDDIRKRSKELQQGS